MTLVETEARWQKIWLTYGSAFDRNLTRRLGDRPMVE